MNFKVFGLCLLGWFLMAATAFAETSDEEAFQDVEKAEAAARSAESPSHGKQKSEGHKAGSKQPHKKKERQESEEERHGGDKRAALADFKRAALADFKRAALADFKRAALADFKRAALADFKRAALADFKRAALADFKRAALADFKRSQHEYSNESEMPQHVRKHERQAGDSEVEKRAYYWDVCSRWVNGQEKLYVCKKLVR